MHRLPWLLLLSACIDVGTPTGRRCDATHPCRKSEQCDATGVCVAAPGGQGGGSGGGATGGGSTNGGGAGGSDTDGGIPLARFQNWTRNPANPIFRGNSLADAPHVWEESPGNYRMVYTDISNALPAIAMATSTNLIEWKRITNSQYPNGVILQGAGPGGHDINLDGAFYRRALNGKHQVFYGGYSDVTSYDAAIYLAEADNVHGPYLRAALPVILWTPQGPDAQAMTSPTLVDHQGTVYMTYIGWDSFPGGSVRVVGATSTTDGRSWVKQGALSWNDIFGVEAHTEKGPDGQFYRVGVVDGPQGQDTFVIGRASHPFGPYQKLPNAILTPGGVNEGDTITSPSLMFLSQTKQAFMHYAALNAGGSATVVSVATCQYGP